MPQDARYVEYSPKKGYHYILVTTLGMREYSYGHHNPTLYKNLAEINSKPSIILSANAVEWAILRVFSSFCCVEWTATFEQQSNSTGLSPHFQLWLFSVLYF